MLSDGLRAFFGTYILLYCACKRKERAERRKRRTMEREAGIMFNPKGYYTNHGYTGFLPDGRRISFPTLDEYIDYVREIADDMR